MIDDQGWRDSDDFDDLAADLKADLWPGESLLWSERPALPRMRRIRPIPLLFVAALTGLSGVSLAGMLGVLHRESIPPEAVLIGFGLAPLVLGGLIAVDVARRSCGWAARRWALARTVYAMTDQRVIIGRYDATDGLRSYSLIPGMIADTSPFEYADGTGDLVFEGVESSARRAVGFFGIRRVRSVDRLLHETLIDPFPRW
ncbi:MAG: hypothetical protein BGO49_29545 [Planctomycetales bacterium 71-10]|nr:MAG: hypothetical protein BGO49_29545 [Planctomycetales bacterium 71-10]